MNKSTPISQLPSAASLSNTFVNDQQKHMVAQAQNAVNTMVMPQSTQVTDMNTDDDATIQEVLNQVQNMTQPQQQPMTMPSMEHMMPQQMQHMMPPPPQQMQHNFDPSMFNTLVASQMAGPAPPPMGASSYNSYMGNLETFVTNFADDIKVAAIIFVVIVATHFVPFDKFIGKYIALEKIPYHDILVKALIAAVVAIFIKKVVVK
jgi:hypothetical protein